MPFRIGDEEVIFVLLDEMKHSLDFDDTCFYKDVNDSIVQDFVQEMVHNKPFEESLDDY